MVFSSISFLFYFLPLFLLTFYASRCSKNTIAVFSIVFYAWGEPSHVILLCLSILMNYALGLLIERESAQQTGQAGLWVSIGIVGNLVPLLYFKYASFIAQIILDATGRPFGNLSFLPAALPLGISFYTFHALSYLVDVYRADVRAERSIRDMILYIAMFPQLVAGPLIRYKMIADEIQRPRLSIERTAQGIRLFIVGLSQKVLIANTLSVNADAIFALPPDLLSQPLAWVGIVCYTLQIYFDFGGYSLMAMGLAFMIGFTFPQNFNYPYVAHSMMDFWRRWHISLSAWFRDYVYIPLGGNRKSPARIYVNLTLVFLLCGLWHGAAWNFLVWGLAHGVFLVAERLGLDKTLAASPPAVRHAYVLIVVVATWTLFRADSLHHAGFYLAAMVGLGVDTPLAAPLQRYLGSDVVLAFVTAMAVVGPWGLALALRAERYLAGEDGRIHPHLEIGGLMMLLLLVSLSLAGGAYNPFIYFRF